MFVSEIMYFQWDAPILLSNNLNKYLKNSRGLDMRGSDM